MKNFTFCQVAFALLGLLLPTIATSAQFQAADYNQLKNEIEEKGVALVMVSLDSVPLADIKDRLANVKEAMSQKALSLFEELGMSSDPLGYWNNGIGQAGFYVNADGLEKLVNSDVAESFQPDTTRALRVRSFTSDGSLEVVEQDILNSGFTEAEIFLNLENIDYDIKKDHVVYYAEQELSGKVQQSMNGLLPELSAESQLNSSPSASKPSFVTSINLEDFYTLRESKEVRAIRPLNFKDTRETQWPSETLSDGSDSSYADVIIVLRGGEYYTPKTGYLSEGAVNAQKGANQRAFDNVLISSGINKQPEFVNGYPEIASFQIKLSHSELEKLKVDDDPRILSVSLNRPVAMVTATPDARTVNAIELAEPQTLCFDKSTSRGDSSNFTYDYIFTPEPDDIEKAGLVFVGFRLKSNPDNLFLMHGSKSSNSKGWAEYSEDVPFENLTGIPLQPVLPLEIIHEPMDLSAFEGDGEILVGYGLETYEGESQEEIFSEMLMRNRYSVVRNIGGNFVNTRRICVEVTVVDEFSTTSTLLSD